MKVSYKLDTGKGGTNVMAILGLVFAFVFPLLGLVFSIIALNQIKKTKEEGHGLALAGLIISIVYMSLIILVILFGVLSIFSPMDFGMI